MENMSLRPTKRKRQKCLKCGQELSHSAYNRHKNLEVFPGKGKATLSEPPSQIFTDSSDIEEELIADIETSDNEESIYSSENDDMVISDSDEIMEYECDFNQPVDSNENIDIPKYIEQRKLFMHKVIANISIFLSFFQLCYHVFERGILLLLSLLKSLFTWLSSLSMVGAANVKLLAENLPANVYFLQKMISGRNNGQKKSKLCSYVEFPHHPQVRRRIQCGTMLLQNIKSGSYLKLVPHKVYPYVSLKNSLSRLFNQENVQQRCEHWRSRSSSPGVYNDIYDGEVWKKFQVVSGRPFLEATNNLCLKLNLDWFNPFDHLTYSVGVLYLVIENLPRCERYKLENIIIVGTIPGPKEPKHSITSYLQPLIDELLDLWQGTMLKDTSLLGVTPVRCALTCVSCDLPATKDLRL